MPAEKFTFAAPGVAERYTVRTNGEMLDLIAYHKYGYSSGAVEAIFAANHHARELRTYPRLSAGMTLLLPGLAPPPTRGLVSVFGD